ncbi:MAG: DUF1385 domain-containing protein [Tissierellia bacterium]|nr:DUF1385 domain-containing protein [Tissierellia bacterium]
MKVRSEKELFKTSIGGQALIEGVMMKGPDKTAMAVRKPNGEIELRLDENKDISSYPFLNWPLIRGCYRLFLAMSEGIEALTYSASFWEEEEEDKKPGLLDRLFPKQSERIATGLSILFSFVLAFVFFMVLPNFLANLARHYTESSLLLNLLEGLLRILIFFIYLMVISRVEDIYRVLQYHGAEHKSIACYEHGDELTVENAMKHSRLHPRCGTSFLFMVLVISILVLSFFGWPNPVLRLVIRLIMLPLIAGIAYEINRVLGRCDKGFCQALARPGLEIQRLSTTKEPDEKQVEVALAALKAVIPEDEGRALW